MNVLIGNFLIALGQIGNMIINLYIMLIIIRIILSWLQISPYSNQVAHFFYIITDPYLRFFRKIIPPFPAGTAYIDFSPILGIVILMFARTFILNTLTTWGQQLVGG